eukprot:scaffold17750_cov107-Isochrysis_galbana.AAC.2
MGGTNNKTARHGLAQGADRDGCPQLVSLARMWDLKKQEEKTSRRGLAHPSRMRRLPVACAPCVCGNRQKRRKKENCPRGLLAHPSRMRWLPRASVRRCVGI